MAKLTRAFQKIFGSTAPSGQIAKVGSLAAGTPVTYSGTTADPVNIQALSNYLDGWSSCVLGNGNPAKQDMTALQWLFSRQLAYLFQAGIAEYDASTVYYTNSFCQVSGVVYRSLIDNNTGNTPASSPSDWAVSFAARKTPTIITITASGTYTTSAGVSYIVVEAVGAGGGGQGALSVGGAGGDTTFGGAGLIQAFGALGGGSGFEGGGGQVGTIGAGASGFAIYGGSGGSTTSDTATKIGGGTGGSSAFGGGASGGSYQNRGLDAPANTGGGGGGNGCDPGSGAAAGAGGGAGGYLKATIGAPSATYAVVIGAGGSAGGGTSSTRGGTGGSGKVVVTEYY